LESGCGHGTKPGGSRSAASPRAESLLRIDAAGSAPSSRRGHRRVYTRRGAASGASCTRWCRPSAQRIFASFEARSRPGSSRARRFRARRCGAHGRGAGGAAAALAAARTHRRRRLRPCPARACAGRHARYTQVAARQGGPRLVRCRARPECEALTAARPTRKRSSSTRGPDLRRVKKTARPPAN